MKTGTAILLAGLMLLGAQAWAQQKTESPESTTQARTLRAQLATMRKQLAAAREALEAETAARQDLLAQLAALKDQQAQLRALREQVALLAREVQSLKANSVLDLNGYLSFGIANGYPVALFRGINVQIVNGTGDTQTANGLGNLVVGYDRPSAGSFICSLGTADSEAACRASGGVWAQSHKGGSHNIVGGDFNNYPGYGGLILGLENAITAPYAVVIGGARNRAGGGLATVTGGSYNTSGGIYSTVSGGFANQAMGDFSAVGGGSQRVAPGAQDWAAGALTQDQ